MELDDIILDPNCPACDGRLALLGVLGWVASLRCTACGLDSTQYIERASVTEYDCDWSPTCKCPACRQERARRQKFCLWVEHAGEDEHELMLAAEGITEAMAATLKPLSRWGVNEKNLRHGMNHWHWTIPDERLAEVRAYLTGLGLTETDDTKEVW